MDENKQKEARIGPFLKKQILQRFKNVFQLRRRGHRRPPQHARRNPFRKGPLRRPRLAEMAVRCLVQRRHAGQQDGGRWGARVR